MITKSEKEIILRCAKKYDVSDIYLFGSSAEKKLDYDYRDIDLGVKGLRPKYFFKLYTELFKSLPKPVDLIDMTEKSLFNSLIEEEGIRIYEKSR